jgi:hypothetical protein
MARVIFSTLASLRRPLSWNALCAALSAALHLREMELMAMQRAPD